jgi:hypothetical protein
VGFLFAVPKSRKKGEDKKEMEKEEDGREK